MKHSAWALNRKQEGTPNSSLPEQSRLIRYPEAKNPTIFRIDDSSVADDIGHIDPMPRAFVGNIVIHKAFTGHLRPVLVKKVPYWEYGTFPQGRAESLLYVYNDSATNVSNRNDKCYVS